MEGIANRPQNMLSPQQNIAIASPFTGLQQHPDKLPPPYDEAQIVQSMENEKVSIYRHPLFPLLAMLLEKCEQATQTSDCPTATTFDNDIKNFLIQHNREGKPCFSGDQELDNLIIKAIQVFRIHLLELEKVNELCKDFCQRYIACLKGKMQSENLLRSPLPSSFQTPTVGCVTQSFQQLPSAQPQQAFLQQQTQLLSPQEVTYYTTTPCSVAMATPPNVSVIAAPVQQQQAAPMSLYTPQPQQPATIVVTAAPTSGQTLVFTQVPQQQQMVVNPTNVTYSCSTPTSIMTMAPTTPTSSTSAGSPTEIVLPTAIPMAALDSPTDTPDSSRKTKRGVLPKQATQIMKTWLFSHLMHPYPTEDEKRTIASQTNLTILQVNNWFINARRRILQPMLDAGNPESHKAKKSKIQTRPAQRFWPDSLVPTQYGAPVPIIPNNLAIQGQRLPNTVQMQTLPAGSMPITVAMPTIVNSGGGAVTLPPGTLTLPPNFTLQQGSNIVIVTLPSNASTICTVTDSMSSTQAQSTVSTSTVTSQSETAPRGDMSPMLSGVHHGSPALSQGSPLPTMAQNGGMGNMGSPNQIITTSSNMSPVDSLVHSLALQNPDG